ncbi:MAG: ATP-binding protein [Magnetococcus sp. YQC-3]
MVASRLKDPASHLIQGHGVNNSILPIAVIYGANASGKSNFLEAWSFFRHAILNSHRVSGDHAEIPRQPFRLDPEMADSPSRFDCDVIIQGKRHHYGFVVNNERIMEEWLYVFPEGRRQIWFHRNHENQPEFSFGANLKGKKQVLSEFTAPNSLFLTTAATNQHEQLMLVRNYFRDNQHILSFALPENPSQLLPRKHLENDAKRQRIVHFLAQGDTGIIDLHLKTVPIPEKVREQLRKEMEKLPGNTTQDIPKELEELELGHRGKFEQPIFLDLHLESQGTLSLLHIMGPILDALDRGSTLWIDELSANIHPLLARKIVALFGSPATNPKGAQLICATHDTHLLSGTLLRRDQIWFTEKDQEGATHLYPLTDYHVRAGENLERDYLQGRFGAIPHLGSLEQLLGGPT